MSQGGRVGLVLSGGGARGAYEVGLIAGLVDVLGLRPEDPAPFQVFAGTSVGAINAAYLAANAHRGDMDIEGLVQHWLDLRLQEHMRFDPLGFLGWPPKLPKPWKRRAHDDPELGPLWGRSLLDARPFDVLVRGSVDWVQLRKNVGSGAVHALVIAATHIGTGRTHMFIELAPGAQFIPSPDPARVACPGAITGDHVLASAAIPLVFPARRVGDAFFCDGGLRFNTPLSPAIRAGAARLMVIPLLRGHGEGGSDQREQYPSPFFLLGKLVAALMLDPIDYDLQVLSRFNQIIGTLERSLDDEALERFQEVVVKMRGAPYRQIEALHFRPSGDIGRMAGTFLRTRGPRSRGRWFSEMVLRRAALMQRTVEADLVSFLLFDGEFARRLIDLGRHDARLHAEEMRAFFLRG